VGETLREIHIGLLGAGTVATGVVRLLAENAEKIEARLGARVRIVRIACRDQDKPRDPSVARDLLTTDPASVLDDPDIDIVVELAGGVDNVYEHLLAALRGGKHVVTANKALLAAHGETLMTTAAQHEVDLFYEASVGGGIPIIRSIREALASDRIDALYGIINGTTNYILSEMTARGETFETVLAMAAAKGYAEADPSLDVDGHDAAQKLAILTTLAFGTSVAVGDIPTEGIRAITPHDLRMADELGYVVKLIASAVDTPHGLDVRVAPAFVAKDNLLSRVDGVFNAVLLQAHACGFQLFYGKGAGMMPTASAVVSDVIEVSRNLLQGRHGRIPGFGFRRKRHSAPKLAPPELSRARYYLHVDAVDRPGVLGQVASILGEYDISIAEMKQSGRDRSAAVPVVMLTHDADEGRIDAALRRIDALEVTVNKTRRIRVVEPEVAT
jgi:homoserine dehydrogenase